MPEIDVLMLPRQDQPPLGVGESASVPSAAAIANAIFDATGVRLRDSPFTPERILAGTARRSAAPEALPQRRQRPPSKWKNPFAVRPGLFAAPCRGVRHRDCHRHRRAAVARDRADCAARSIGVFRSEPLRRGQQLAALGDCTVCHTSAGGAVNAGGRALETPFGVIYSTNITPDVETGIGNWSYPAFERAMREGIHRDGKHLYPALPVHAFRQDQLTPTCRRSTPT